jgi:aspartate oxidase
MAKSEHKFHAPPSPQDRGTPLPCPGNSTPAPTLKPTEVEKLTNEVRCLLWEKVGILRNGKDLAEAVKRLGAISIPAECLLSRECYESSNILTVAQLIARCSLAREESRGAHYRSDFPLKSPYDVPKHSYLGKKSPTYFA